MLERSTASAARAALVRVNLTVSTAVFPEFASPMMSPLMLRVEDVSSKPPRTTPLLFSELSSSVLRTAKAISTMAVSGPVMPL